MQGAWKLLSWATGQGNEEESRNPVSAGSDFGTFVSPPDASWIPEEAEEYEDSYGPPPVIESETTITSTTELTGRNGGNNHGSNSSNWPDADDDESGQNSSPGLQENDVDFLSQRFRKFLLDQEASSELHRDTEQSQNHGNSRDGFPSRSRGGPETIRTTSMRASGLLQVQLEKLGKLERLDRDWDSLFSNVTEDSFPWPWELLTEKQVALGKLDFKKFIVVLSFLGELDLKPENVLSMEQIRSLQRLPVEEVAGYILEKLLPNAKNILQGNVNQHSCQFELLQNDKNRPEYRCLVETLLREWLKNGPVSFECNVDKFGVCKFKVVQPRPVSTLLHRTFGEDRIMPVYFNEYPADDKFLLIREGILVGLRRYRFWTFKDSGKEEFKSRNKSYDKDYERAVKCFFVCTESLADIDLVDPSFKYFSRIRAARCHIMHIHTVTTMPKFASRLQLALSKSTKAKIDLNKVEIKQIPDILCKTLDNSENRMSNTDGTGEMSPAVARLLPCSVSNGRPDSKEVDRKEDYPTLVQVRMFWKGMAIKGCFQVNHQLEGLKIHYRPSMVKVKPDPRLEKFPTINSLEVLNTSHKPRDANLSQDLIILLSIGGVPSSYFRKLLRDALDNIKNILKDRKLAEKEVENCPPDYSLGDQLYRMIRAGIPMNNPQMQKNLRLMQQDKMKDLRRGCVPLRNTRHLMGTSDPTKGRVLKPNQVAIAMGDGKIVGKVLVYKNPGKHWGDVHAFDAVWDERLNPYVGPGKYTIFFSVQGDRPVVDEIANSDLDGDLFWVCDNSELISLFKPSTPWKRLGGKINYPVEDAPGDLTPKALEHILFEKFLKSRFTKYKPMPIAASYWTAHMDRYLTLKDEVDPPDELSLISESIEDLIDIFYRALDADKTGEEVKLPAKLRPEYWPHHMKKEHHTYRQFYHSPSILGQLYDMTDVNLDDFGYRHEETIVYDPNFQYGRFDKYVDKWKGLLALYNKEMKGAKKEEQGRIIAKYQQMLTGDGQSLAQTWEEASALYHVNHEHAVNNWRKGYPPSLHCAMTVALTELCEIYARRKGEGPPIVTATSTRRELSRRG